MPLGAAATPAGATRAAVLWHHMMSYLRAPASSMVETSGERTAFSPEVEKGLPRLSLFLFLPLDGYPSHKSLTTPSRLNRTAFTTVVFFVFTSRYTVGYYRQYCIPNCSLLILRRINLGSSHGTFIVCAGPHWSN